MYYASNEWDYFSSSADISYSDNKHNSKNEIWKCIYFTLILQSSISHW